MSRIDRSGSASASLPAMMQPAVPPVWKCQFQFDVSTIRLRDQRTSCDDHINLVDLIWELSV